MTDPGTGGVDQERWFRQLDQQVRVLDRERQKFAAVVNQSDTYAFVTDTASTIRWVNRAMSLRGPQGDDGAGWIGRSCRDVCSLFDAHDSPGACASCPVSRALAANNPVHHEFRDAGEGRARTLYLSALPITGMDGQPQEVLVMMQDVSDLMTLRDSEERYRVVTQAASDGIVTIDETGAVIFVNAAMERIFGHAASELVGQPLTQLMPRQLAERHRTGLRRYLESGERRMPWESIQLPALHKSGREIVVEMSFGEYVSNGRRLFTGIMRDITSRRQAEAVLKQTQERLRAVVANSPIVLFAIDATGTFTLSEGRGLEALGLRPGEVVGRSAFEIYAGVPRIVENLKRAQSSEELYTLVSAAGV